MRRLFLSLAVLVAGCVPKTTVDSQAIAGAVRAEAIPEVELTKAVSLHAVTRTSIVVLFFTDVPVAASVEYEAGTSGGHTTTEPAAVTRHAMTLSGLTADTLYHYRLRAGTASADGSFTTAVDWAASPRPFSFAVVGDARGHADWKRVAAAVLAKNPRFMIQTGDATTFGGAADWADYYASGKELFAHVPVYATQGNHDTGSNFSAYNLAPRSSSGSELFYAFVYGNAAFVAIDTVDSSSAMTAWVKSALVRLRGGPLFAFHHHPLYSCGSHGSSTSLQQTYQRAFEDNHVTADYSGHDHALIVWEAVRGVHYVVSGGGGARLYQVENCLGPYARSVHGFLIVDVDGQTIQQTLYDQDGVELYRSGPFLAFGAAPELEGLGDLVADQTPAHPLHHAPACGPHFHPATGQIATPGRPSPRPARSARPRRPPSRSTRASKWSPPSISGSRGRCRCISGGSSAWSRRWAGRCSSSPRWGC